MSSIRIASVVEGHGEAQALPVLLRRIAGEIASDVLIDVLGPIRRPRSSIVKKPGELERAVEFAAIRARPAGGVLVLLDSDDDCPALLGPELLKRARTASLGLPVATVLAHREFECWFIAAADSIRGKRGLPNDLTAPLEPESVRGAKAWLRQRMRDHTYSETTDQPALAAVFDMQLARRAASFDKCYRDVRSLIHSCRSLP